MRPALSSHVLALAVALTCAQEAWAQVLMDAPGNIPQGAPFNNSVTEQVDFADIDSDGDWDCGIADRGDFLDNDQNRIWVNQGGLQAGTIGFFVDETATRAPLLNDASYDIEFVDFDADGDPDAYIVNSAKAAGQGCRWWTNQGGLQSGSAGFYVDETSLRFVEVGRAGSSVAPSLVLPMGNFMTYSQDQDFADIDADGDLDLIAATLGGSSAPQEPTRIFLNDGLGHFREFNPSGQQLLGASIPNGSPALWAEGVQQHGTNDVSGAFADIAATTWEMVVGDVEGDFDVDLLFVDLEHNSAPRAFQNRSSDTGALIFRDVTGTTWPEGWGDGIVKFGAELADFDGDDELDLFGLGWSTPVYNGSLRGKGDGTFVEPKLVVGQEDPEAADVLDYDADGDVDIYVVAFLGHDTLVGNHSTSAGLQFAVVWGAVSFSHQGIATDADAADVDGDGDDDVMRVGYTVDHLLLNVLNQPDTTAPRLAHLEQPADHAPGSETRIRVHVYDNAGADQTAYAQHMLSYSVDNGPFVDKRMTPMGGQVYRCALPASAVGNVRYFARSTDEHGNAGLSALKAIDTAGGCSGQPATYCTPKLNSDGCLPRMSFEGAPKVGGPTSFLIRGTDVLANANGLLIYSKAGPNSAPFNGGVLCVGAGLLRTPGQNSGGAGACGGTLTFDFNAHAGLGGDPGLVPGQKIWAQYWYRDVVSPGGNGLTDGVTFTLCP